MMANELIDFNAYPLNNMLKYLFIDKTTKKNIFWATNSYVEFGDGFDERDAITEERVVQLNLQPRVNKSNEQQFDRTRKKAEVFTPSWICNKMNNHCDDEWFGKSNVFNYEEGQAWLVNDTRIPFAGKKSWEEYVDSRRLEITCGEAPYIVSRYDAATGEVIPVEKRIGILDRKLRVVNENAQSEIEWLQWVYRAYQSVYGYEFQGDNLLLARINLFLTIYEYMFAKWGKYPTLKEAKIVANIVCWNIWQMDGMTGLLPYEHKITLRETSLFEEVNEDELYEAEPVECKIYDWRRDNSRTFNSVKRGNL